MVAFRTFVDEGETPRLGRYVPFARIGNGGMADVFLAVASSVGGFNKLAVVKRLRCWEDAYHVEMFLDEARIAARLRHPNIVDTYEVGNADGRLFLAMEYLEGQSLSGILGELGRSGESLGEGLAILVTTRILRGLHYAHELRDYDGSPLGIVHRDVSPHNVFVTYDGHVKLLDFGIAKASVNTRHTDTGVLKGKARYMSPEQASGLAVDCRADIFSVGVILWEMLAKRRLYEGETLSVLREITEHDAPLLRTVDARCPEELEHIVHRALSRDRELRYKSADEMRRALEDYARERELEDEVDLTRIVSERFAAVRATSRTLIEGHLKSLADGERASATRMCQPPPPAESGFPLPSQRPSFRATIPIPRTPQQDLLLHDRSAPALVVRSTPPAKDPSKLKRASAGGAIVLGVAFALGRSSSAPPQAENDFQSAGAPSAIASYIASATSLGRDDLPAAAAASAGDTERGKAVATVREPADPLPPARPVEKSSKATRGSSPRALRTPFAPSIEPKKARIEALEDEGGPP